MDLKNIIFHALHTQRHSSNVHITERSDELALPNVYASQLVEQAKKSYSKDSSVAYAQFDNYGWFPSTLTKLINNEITFFEFSTVGLKELKTQMESETLTTGGHLFFIRYFEGSTDFMLTLLLKDIEGLVIEQLELTESYILNLEKLHFGARVNIGNWKSNKGNYITFLKGSQRQSVTSYFKKFLCIDDDSFNEPKKNTKSLATAVKDYCNLHLDNDDKQKYTIRRRVVEALNSKHLQNEPIKINEIASLVCPDDPDSFVIFINDNDYGINPEFKVDKSSIKLLTKHQGHTANISISFEQSALEDGLIKTSYEEIGGIKKPVLIIKDIPKTILADLFSDD